MLVQYANWHIHLPYCKTVADLIYNHVRSVMCIDSNGYMSTNHDLQERNEDTFDAWLAGRVSQEADNHLLADDNHLLADDDHLLANDDRLLADGTVLSEYKVVAFLGRGGCGEVYSARHEKLGSMAAVKILRKDTPSMRLRFEREAQILAKKRYREFPQFIAYGEYHRACERCPSISRTT